MCDDPNNGVPSDHSIPIIYPVTCTTLGKQQKYIERVTRPLPDSAVRQFGRALNNEDWSKINAEGTSEEQELDLQTILARLLDQHCPTKTVKLRPQVDKPFITAELKKLDRQRKREYKKHGKSEKYHSVNKLFETKYKKASTEYLNKMMLDLEESNPSKANKILKRLGAQPGDLPDEGNFVLPLHEELGLTAKESADRIAEKFAEISQEFPAITLQGLPERVQEKIRCAKASAVPYISRQKVESKITKAKKTKGGVPGDIPAKLVKEFGPELAPPLSQLFRKISTTGKWPKRWRLEQGLPLKKTNNPMTEDDLRIISLTPFFSKTFEQIVLDWLLEHVDEQIDSFQYGGRKGTSSNHYLIDLITFILYNQDLPESRAVLATMVDFSKAFNRQNHLILVTKLSDMGVPGWLLKIVIGFLEERQMIVTYNGATSGTKEMPGGGPQGTVLGMFLFLILINKAGIKDQNRRLGEKLTSAASKRDKLEKMHVKYVDDMTMAQSINLKDELENDQNRKWTKPAMKRDRHEQCLPLEKNQMQVDMNQLCNYANENEMRLNTGKTKTMLFNTAKNWDFLPEIHVDGINLEVVEEYKLLGVMITSDLKWDTNTEHITKKAFSRLWMIRRLKNLGLNTESLLQIFRTQVRSLLEYGAVTWHSMLTDENSKSIERVQKSALSIILGPDYICYENALERTKLERLDQRRIKLSLSFAKKAVNHPQHSSWFNLEQTDKQIHTRSVKPLCKPVQARTQRLSKSPIVFLTNLLNVDHAK